MNQPSDMLTSPSVPPFFDNVEQWEVMCNELAMETSEKICRGYQSIEQSAYYIGATNPNYPYHLDKPPDLHTVFKADQTQLFNEVYDCVISHIAPFLLSSSGNFTVKLRSLQKSLEYNTLLAIPQLAHQASGVCQQSGAKRDAENMKQQAQQVIDCFKQYQNKPSGGVKDKYEDLKIKLWETRLQHKLDTSSFVSLLTPCLINSIRQAYCVGETIAQAQRVKNDHTDDAPQVIQWSQMRQKIDDTRHEKGYVTVPSSSFLGKIP